MTTPFNIRNQGRKSVALTGALRTVAGELVRAIPPSANLLVDPSSITENARELASLVKLGHIVATPAIPAPTLKPKPKQAADAVAADVAALKEMIDAVRREVIAANAEISKLKAEVSELKKQAKPPRAPDPSVPPPPTVKKP